MPAGYAPPPPREPTAAAKDLIFAYAGAQKAQLLVGVLFVLIGGPLSAVFAWGLPADLALLAAGRPVEARIVGARTDGSVEVMGENPTVVQFSYSVNGVDLQAESNVMGTAPASFHAGEPADAEVVPFNPAWARLKGGKYGSFGWVGAFALLFPLLGLGLTRAAIASNRREIRAFKHGRAVTGKVVAAREDTSTEINGRHPFVVTWEFVVDGRPHQGSLSNMNRALLAPLTEGSAVTVLYLETDPRTNTLYLE